MMYKYVYVFYCASINVVEIFKASYDVSVHTTGTAFVESVGLVL